MLCTDFRKILDENGDPLLFREDGKCMLINMLFDLDLLFYCNITCVVRLASIFDKNAVS